MGRSGDVSSIFIYVNKQVKTHTAERTEAEQLLTHLSLILDELLSLL